MDIEAFLEMCAGQWFSQRTSYHLGQEQAENSKTEICIERLSPTDAEVLSLCEYSQIDPNLTLGGTKASWENPAGGKNFPAASATLILVPDAGNPQRGELLQAKDANFKEIMAGRYLLGEDEALTLTLEGDGTYWEERLWFASPNLRLRTSLIKRRDNWSSTAFYSEIRRISSKIA
jgi:hypothetical protein